MPCWITVCRAYPRGCGEWAEAVELRVTPHGLPPRVRGMVPDKDRADGTIRLTPAGAGNGSMGSFACAVCTAYPRGCGEWEVDLVGYEYYAGLPPRVRGMEPRQATFAPTTGLTPAGAGNGPQSIMSHRSAPAYPRGCGEWRGTPVQISRCAGLPPRVRGMVVRLAEPKFWTRLTPAGAGNGRPPRSGSGIPEAYPRGCGEWIAGTSARLIAGGLPPRVRGMGSQAWWFRGQLSPVLGAIGLSRCLSDVEGTVVTEPDDSEVPVSID